VDFCSPSFCILAGAQSIGIQNTRELNLKLNSGILVKYPIYTVLVIGRGEGMRNHKLAPTSDNNGVVSVISVLEKNTCVFLVDADRVLDGHSSAGVIGEVCV